MKHKRAIHTTEFLSFMHKFNIVLICMCVGYTHTLHTSLSLGTDVLRGLLWLLCVTDWPLGSYYTDHNNLLRFALALYFKVACIYVIVFQGRVLHLVLYMCVGRYGITCEFNA